MESQSGSCPPQPPAALYQLQGILQEILKSFNDEKLSELSDSALKLLERLSPISKRKEQRIGMQLQDSAINMWNKTVTLKSAGAISLQLNAQMRYIACSLMVLTTPTDTSAAPLQKQIMIATKTGRAWLDCDNFAMAETAFTIATECYERLRLKYPINAKERPKLKEFLRLLCYKMEATVGLTQHETALSYLQQAKELLHSLESEVLYVSMLCYNFGLDMFHKAEYQHSVTWLKESYEIGRDSPSVDVVKQARTLRLLANTLLEWDGSANWQKALSAVGLANSEHSHASGLLLKLSILLQYDPSNDILTRAFEDTLHHPDLSIDIALAAIKMSSQYNRNDLVFSGINYLSQRYKATPHLIQVHLLHLELLLQSKQENEAMQLIEDIITAHNTGEPLDIKARQQFHLVLWRQASIAYESSEFNRALSWYNYSLSLFPSQGEIDSNIAKLQRNCAWCYLNLKEYEAAKEAVQSAKYHDSSSPQTHFLAFKLALLSDQQEEAVESLKLLVDCGKDDDEKVITGLTSLAAQVAFEQSNHSLAVVALDELVKTCSKTEQTFTALRCLLRIKLTNMDSMHTPQNKSASIRDMLQYLKQATTLLPSLDSPTSQQKEANWFLKVAWNLALQCNLNYKEMADFFIICHQLSCCLPSDISVLRRQRSCQLMAAAAFIQLARAADSHEEKETALLSVLDHVSTCHSISQQLEGGGMARAPKDPTPSLLLLYEFEAKLLLGHSDLQGLLDKVSQLPSVEAKTLETMAALCVRVPPTEETYKIGIQALKIAIEVHTQTSPLDGERLSRCYHSLVQLVMGRDSGTESMDGQESLKVLNQILDLLDSKAKDKLPEIEIVWFLSRAWNFGIHLYSALKFTVAERWCSLAMRFLKHLTQHKTTYEEQMSSIYSEVLQKVNSGHFS